MQRKPPPLDATVRVVTPENIAFEYRLAGPFRRLPAFLLDGCILIALIIIAFIVVFVTIGFASSGLAEGLFMIFNFVIWWFYGVMFETFMNGQTPGKHVAGLR